MKKLAVVFFLVFLVSCAGQQQYVRQEVPPQQPASAMTQSINSVNVVTFTPDSSLASPTQAQTRVITPEWPALKLAGGNEKKVRLVSDRFTDLGWPSEKITAQSNEKKGQVDVVVGENSEIGVVVPTSDTVLTKGLCETQKAAITGVVEANRPKTTTVLETSKPKCFAEVTDVVYTSIPGQVRLEGTVNVPGTFWFEYGGRSTEAKTVSGAGRLSTLSSSLPPGQHSVLIAGDCQSSKTSFMINPYPVVVAIDPPPTQQRIVSCRDRKSWWGGFLGGLTGLGGALLSGGNKEATAIASGVGSLVGSYLDGGCITATEAFEAAGFAVGGYFLGGHHGHHGGGESAPGVPPGAITGPPKF